MLFDNDAVITDKKKILIPTLYEVYTIENLLIIQNFRIISTVQICFSSLLNLLKTETSFKTTYLSNLRISTEAKPISKTEENAGFVT